MALIYNATFAKNTRKLSFEDKAGNEIYSFIVPERAPTVDDITKPLTFRATQDGSTVNLRKNGSPDGTFQTSRDGGKIWADYTLDSAITLNTGDEVSFRAKADRTSAQDARNYFYFQMTGKIEAWNNVMSLYSTNDFATYESVVDYAFSRLFVSCMSLTKAPALPATTLSDSCYWNMFGNCFSLTKAPELPATALAIDCYYEMFSGCQSLTKAPELPATTLAWRCYYSMFSGCQSLTKAPELPATELANSCYYLMFSGCQSLKEVRISATTTAMSALESWLYGVSETGDFYCDPNATIFPTDSASGCPSGWTRHDIAPAVDDLTKPLTFRATQDGSTVKLTESGSPSGSFQTSRDGGNTWTDYTLGTAIALNTGEEVSFRAKADRTAQTYSGAYFYFQMTGKIEAWHNVMSMYRTSDFATNNTVLEHAFINLFKDCTSLVKAPVLPVTTLSEDCYSNMFDGCQSLTEAPELPATTLARFCYWEMFSGCSKLKEVRIAATTTGYNALNNWLSGVSATGDFYCDPNATIFPTNSTSGIPANWNRRALSDYPVTP